MHRRLIIKKTWLSAFSYAQSCISLVFCYSLGFLVPWFSSLTAESDLADFLCCVSVLYGEEADPLSETLLTILLGSQLFLPPNSFTFSSHIPPPPPPKERQFAVLLHTYVLAGSLKEAYGGFIKEEYCS
jgi:hypothetical protein